VITGGAPRIISSEQSMKHRFRWPSAALAVSLLSLTHCAQDEEGSADPPVGGASTTGGLGNKGGAVGPTPTGGATPVSQGGTLANTGGASQATGGVATLSGGSSAVAGSNNGGSNTGGAAGSGSGGRTQSEGGARASGGASGAGAGQGGAPASSGGKSQGGAQSAGAAGSSAGSPAGGSGGDDETISMTIPTPSNGQGEIRPSTTLLKNAANGGKDVWDFENQKIGVNNTSDCDDGEDQVTVFEVEDGVTVKNLIVAGGLPAGNGIVCRGNCTLDHVYWEDICEDAATNTKDGATMTLNHVIALHASDKVFQHNAKGGSKTVVKNSYIADFGKLWRSCGDCTANGGPRHLVIDNVRVDGVKTSIAGANQNYGDTVTITRLFVKGGYNAGNDKPRICQEYQAVTDHNGESMVLHSGASQWNTATCKVRQSDVASF
jgi:hypothetical protein